MAITTDPVCLMTVDEQTATAVTEYDGRLYYFCSTGCRAEFEADPDSFVKAA